MHRVGAWRDISFGRCRTPEASGRSKDVVVWRAARALVCLRTTTSSAQRTSGRAIVELLRAGKRVGVSSNSHKAINKLLAEVEAVALVSGLQFRGMK